ncbi:MAG: (2Fe-2S) ferredoxin domain-containing protein [Kofleriaceae bacterium]
MHAAFERALAQRSDPAAVELDWQSCFGRCSQGPNVLVREVVAGPVRVGLAELPARLGGGPRAATALYNGVTPADVPELVGQHVGAGVVVRRLIQTIGPAGPVLATSPVAKRQP